MSQTFRAGVGLVLVDEYGKVFAVERSKERGCWQLPQGGIEDRESPEDAAWRELQEELALGRDHAELVTEAPSWTSYELPRGYQNAKTGRGQVQRWFVFRLRDGAPQPNVKTSGELQEGRWTTMERLIEKTVPFRRPVYRQLLLELGNLLRPSKGAPKADHAFLVADFEHLAESYWRNEEMGERRLQFFVGLVTASAAGIGFLAKGESDFSWSRVRLLTLTAASVLLLFGLLTLLRMMRRNRVTDGYLGAMQVIRRSLLPVSLAVGIRACFPPGRARTIRNGGLTAFTVLINAALAGVVGGVSADLCDASPAQAAIFGGGSAAVLAAIQLWRLWKAERSR